MYSCSGPNTETCPLVENLTSPQIAGVVQSRWKNIYIYLNTDFMLFHLVNRIRKSLTSPNVFFVCVALHFHSSFSLWERR